MYNLLPFAAGSIPVTAVTEEDLRNMKEYATPDHGHEVAKKVRVLLRVLFAFVTSLCAV